jgi:hypothetical protein
MEPIFQLFNVVELAAGTAVVVYGQRALNRYWVGRPGPEVESRLGELDWLALAVAASYAVLTVASLVVGSPA